MSIAGAAEITLRFATINAVGSPAYDQGLVPFARAIERDSGGRIEVDLKPLGSFGRPTELFGMVESGRIEMASTVQGYSPGRFPRSSVMELPMVYDNAEHGTRAIWKLYEEGLIAPDYASVKVLALYVLPPYGFFTVDKPINNVRDLRGLRLRSPSVTFGLAMSRLGIVPLGLPLTMLGETLADDSVDGIAYGWDSLRTTAGQGGPVVEQVRHMLDVNFAAPALMVVMNRKTYDGLDAPLKAAIDRNSGLELSMLNARMRQEAEARTKKELAANRSYKVVSFNADQKAEMARRIEPVFGQWSLSMTALNIDGEKLLTRARTLSQSQTN